MDGGIETSHLARQEGASKQKVDGGQWKFCFLKVDPFLWIFLVLWLFLVGCFVFCVSFR